MLSSLGPTNSISGLLHGHDGARHCSMSTDLWKLKSSSVANLLIINRYSLAAEGQGQLDQA